MNTFTSTRVAAAILFATPLALPGWIQADPKQDYQQAKAAEKEGDYKTAIATYEALIAQFPQDPKLRAALAQARLAAREGTPKGSMEAKLKAIILPEVEFSDADLESVFLYLSQKSEELSQGKLKPNFIYKGSLDDRRKPQITLRLTSVPVSEVIRYVGELSATVFVYEPHAIVGTPVHLSTAQPAAPPSK